MNPCDYETDLRQFIMAMQCRNDKNRIRKLFETREFQELSHDVEKVIAIHLKEKMFVKRVVEEDMNMCKAIRDIYKDGINEGRQEGESRVILCLRKIIDGSSRESLMDEGYEEALINQLFESLGKGYQCT